jgi:hypothetical protein
VRLNTLRSGEDEWGSNCQWAVEDDNTRSATVATQGAQLNPTRVENRRGEERLIREYSALHHQVGRTTQAGQIRGEQREAMGANDVSAEGVDNKKEGSIK